MQNGPSISYATLVDALIADGVIDEDRLVSLLGESRHNQRIAELELALIRQSVLSTSRLLLIKQAVSGLPVLDDPEIRAVPRLPQDLVKRTGALLLELPTPTVAMVEDQPMSVEAIAQALNTTPEIWLMTATQFLEMYGVTYSNEKRDTRKVTSSIYEIFDEAVRQDASDIHLSIGRPPILRVDGGLTEMARQPLDENWLMSECSRLAGEERMAKFAATNDVDFATSYGQARFRVNYGADLHGITVAARRIPTKIPNAADIGLPRAVMQWTELHSGLCLVTGVTGSGKSTTLAAVLNHINTNSAHHIITLEDPVEYRLPKGRSIVHQRELGESFTSFAQGLRQALRQDPDVVLVGELRDPETIKTAISAAETGHLVFGTLHTYDAASTVSRLINSFPADEQDPIRSALAHILKGVVSQTLLPRAHSRGRVAAHEVMVGTPAIQTNLRKTDGVSQLTQTIETGMRDGMQTMERSLASLVRQGIVLEQVAEPRAKNVEAFRRYLRESDE